METDWTERKKMADAEGTTKSEHSLQDSLIWKFIDTDSAGNGRNRRIVDAIFADGSAGALKSFPKLFKNETTEQRPAEEDTKTSNSRKRSEVNIDKDEYGDYLFQEEDDSDIPGKSTRSRPRRVGRGTRAADLTLVEEAAAEEEEEQKAQKLADEARAKGGIASYGGSYSLELRQRLFSLLIKASLAMPEEFMRTGDLYQLLTEKIRHLPLDIFQTFVSYQTLPWMGADAQSTLCEALILRMRESAAPNSNDGYLHQQKLEECYLPYSAHTASVVDIAKYSILLEALMILLADNSKLRNTPILREAVRMGIKRRAKKATPESQRSKASGEIKSYESSCLDSSAGGLVWLIENLPQVDPLDED